MFLTPTLNIGALGGIAAHSTSWLTCAMIAAFACFDVQACDSSQELAWRLEDVCEKIKKEVERVQRDRRQMEHVEEDCAKAKKALELINRFEQRYGCPRPPLIILVHDPRS
jgi:histidine ammonia-lyase